MGHDYGLNFLCYTVFNFVLIFNCFASNVFDTNPASTQENQGFIYNSIQNRSTSDNDTVTETSRQPLVKKWQVGRVSRKHYEIINMLWRKTKIFMDVESTTDGNAFNNNNGTRKYYKRDDNPRHIDAPFDNRAVVSSSTPSFIEFYYLDDNEDLAKMRDPSLDKINNVLSDKRMVKSVNVFKGIPLKPQQSPRITFHANDPNHKRTALTFKKSIKNQNEHRSHHRLPCENLNASRGSTKFENILKAFKLVDILGNKTLFGKKFRTVKIYLNGSYVSTTKKMNKHETTEKSIIESTTVYDKVKFFELYDSHTFLYPTNQEKDDNFEKSICDKDIMSHDKIDLENVDRNIGHSNSQNKSRHEKKHITYSSIKTTTQMRRVLKEPLPSIKPNVTYEFRDKSALETLIKQTRYARIANMSRLAYWSNYPFVAVYVYEPTQTHCDAAGISPHWLIAAGACLSRHHLVHSIEARSAFVTYCGESWRQPERIAYVKYSLVHPKFHPRDSAKRHNYNIGLIQVSSSMVSSCTGWAPISLMSHQFAANPEGSLVSALGWGLDRFGTKYMSKKLPHWPMTVYEGLVYSDSCPGSPAYSKAKRRDADSGANNIYCLLLPPYLGEDTDPVHGGLLLDGGKLIALYLQEERRPSGLQSAQYTGVWRLIPWVLDVAREPEDLETFPLDM